MNLPRAICHQIVEEFMKRKKLHTLCGRFAGGRPAIEFLIDLLFRITSLIWKKSKKRK